MVLSSTSRKSNHNRSKKNSIARSRRRRKGTSGTSTSTALDHHDEDPYNNDSHRMTPLHARDLDQYYDNADGNRPIYRKRRSSLSFNPYQSDEEEYNRKRRKRLIPWVFLLVLVAVLVRVVNIHRMKMLAMRTRSRSSGRYADRGGIGGSGNSTVTSGSDSHHGDGIGADIPNTLHAGPTSSTSMTTMRRIIPNKTPEEKIQRFLSWLNDHGAVISPNVGLASFVDYGGYGLIALNNDVDDRMEEEDIEVEEKKLDSSTPDESEKEPKMKQSSDGNDGMVIHALDEMFTIPNSLIVSAKSILEQYNTPPTTTTTTSVTQFAHQLTTKVKQTFPQSSMEQQDIILAIHLMTECTLGPQSKYEPYLDILPSQTLPRLSSFDATELRMLNDGLLSLLSNNAKRSLGQLYNDEEFGLLLEYMVLVAKEHHGMYDPKNKKKVFGFARQRQRNKNKRLSRAEQEEWDKCLSYDAFHKYVSIVSSRAMVLHGIKYLTPLAGMFNHHPRDASEAYGGDKEEEEVQIHPQQHPYPFTLFHQRNQDGSITVRADRNVRAGQQIFEDYGALDNTLYLEAHGFVPNVNPYHCASIPAKYLIKPSIMAAAQASLSSSSEESTTGLVRNSTLADAMVSLKLLPSNPGQWDASLPDLCIMKDGTVMNDEMAMKYLGIAALHLPPGDGGPQMKMVTEQRTKCILAHNQYRRHFHSRYTDNDEEKKHRDLDMLHLQCVNYKGVKQLRARLVRNIARRIYCDQTMSWEDDEAMLQSLHDVHADATVQMALALKFRVAEKKVLSYLAGDFEFSKESCDSLDALDWMDANAGEDEDEDLDAEIELEWTSMRTDGEADVESESDTKASIEVFNKFIDEMHLPHHRVKAAFVGGGMRVGVVATVDIKESDIYLAMNSASVISPEATMAEIVHYLPLTKNLVYYDGGADVLMWFIFYEKFVAKEKSIWFPYLQMLPTVEDMKRTNPLFFQDEMFDYLAGSDLRSKLIDHKKRVIEKFERATEDFNLIRAFGLDNFNRDNFFWAYSIVHSRSIWWNGTRHLVPLLDLVNCAELRDEQGKPAPAHSTTFIEGLAITQATVSFQEGEQLFENYAQPNYIYFMYHGFLLEENSHDCAFLQLAVPQSLDREMSERLTRNGLSSTNPTFCINDRKSIDSLANFMRVKHKLPGSDNVGLQSDVIGFIRDEFEYRLKRFEAIGDRFGNKSKLPFSLQSMKKILQSEQEFLSNALDIVLQEQ